MTVQQEPTDARRTRISLRKELIAEGIHDRQIAILVADGTLARVRHGAYVSGQVWRDADEDTRHALRARAVLKQAVTEIVLSHVTAAIKWGFPCGTWNSTP